MNFPAIVRAAVLLTLACHLSLAATAQGSERAYTYDGLGNRVAANNLIRFTSAAAFAIEPRRALPGDKINLFGRNFPAGQTSSVTVSFGAIPATVISVAERVVSLTVPSGVTSGAITMSISGGAAIPVGDFFLHGVTLTPSTVDLDYGVQQQFSATVVGASNQNVTWSVTDLAGNTTGVGSITAGGLYTAPTISTNREFPFLIQATNAELRISAYALVKLACIGMGTIPNRTLVSGTFTAVGQRHCYEFAGSAGREVYIACISGSSASRTLALRDSSGRSVARTLAAQRTKIVDLALRQGDTYRIEVYAIATGTYQVWLDQHTSRPRGTWMFPVDDSWHDLTNWSHGQLPVPGSDIVVPDFPAPLSVNVTSNVSCRSLQCEEGLRLSGGTLTLGDQATSPASRIAGALTMTGGTLAGNSDVLVQGALVWSGGTMAGATTATTTVATGASLTIAAPSSSVSLSRIVRHQGAGTWSSGNIQMRNGRFVNEGQLTVNATSGVSVDSYASETNTFETTGTLTKIGAADLSLRRIVSTTSVGLHAGGTIDVQAGRIVVDGPSRILAGLMLTGAGSLDLAGNTTTGEGNVTGSGTLRVTGGTFQVDVAISCAPRLVVTSGTLLGSDALTLTSALAWGGGAMTGAGSTIVAAGASLTIDVGGITDGGTVSLSRVLRHRGTGTWSNGVIQMRGGRFINEGQLSVNAASALSLDSHVGQANTLENTGTLTKVGAADLTLRTIVASTLVGLHAGGTVDVQAGKIVVQGPSRTLAGLNLLGAGSLDLDGNTTVCEGNVTGTGTLRVTGGTLQVDVAASCASRFVVTSGTVLGAGTFTLTNTLDWSGGTMSGTGSTVVGNGANLTIAAPSVNVSLGRILRHQGTGSWTAGIIQMRAGQFVNEGQLTINAATALSIDSYVSQTNTLENTGTLTKVGAADLTLRTIVASTLVGLHAGGTVDVQAGKIVVQGPSRTLSGLNLLGGGSLDLDSNTTVCEGNVTGTGTLRVTGGTLQVDVAASCASRFVVTSGTVLGAGTFTLTNSLDWSGGTMSGTGSTVVGNGANLTIAAPSVNVSLGRILRHQGTGSWTAGAIQMRAGQFVNEGQFTINAATALSIDSYVGQTNTLENTGTLTKVGAADLTLRTIVASTLVGLHAGGTVDVQAGKIAVNGPSRVLAGLNLRGTGVLEFASNTAMCEGSIVGDGLLRLAGGTLQADVNASCAPRLALAPGGTLSGSATFTLTNALDWTGGTMSGTGTTIVASGADLTIAGVASDVLLSRILRNQGAVHWTSGDMQMRNARFINESLMTVTSAAAVSIDSYAGTTNTLENDGTLTKNGSNELLVRLVVAGTAVGLINRATLSLSAGMLRSTSRPFVQTAGTLALASGTTLTGTLDVQGGAVEGAGIVNGNVTNAGTFRPGGAAAAGVLTIAGAFAQTAAGTLALDLGGLTQGTEHDRLAVSGAVTFGGTVAVTLINGFTPVLNDTFDIVGYASRTGTFATCSGCNLGGGLSLVPAYAATALTLVTQ